MTETVIALLSLIWPATIDGHPAEAAGFTGVFRSVKWVVEKAFIPDPFWRKYAQIRLGMNREDVFKVLGRKHYPGFTQNYTVIWARPGSEDQSILIAFTDGKVSYKGFNTNSIHVSQFSEQGEDQPRAHQ
jgi:hypothetical protein